MLNPIQILRSSSRITLVTIIGVPIGFAVSILVARTVLPEQLGQINFVGLWLTYAALISPGIFSGGVREMVHRLGRGELRLALQAQNVGVTGELLWSLVPVSLLLLASFSYQEPLRKWGFLIVGVTYLIGTFSKLLANVHVALQHFDLYARFSLIRIIIPSALIALFVPHFGPLTVLLAATVAESTLLILYFVKSRNLDLRLDFNWTRMRELATVGFPLAFSGFMYWAYRLTGQTSVAFLFPAKELAIYTFSATIITFVTRAFGDFSGVLTPVLWKELGQANSPQELHLDTARITIFVMVAACIVANLVQAGFAPFVYQIVPNYIQSIPIFEVLAFNIVVLTSIYIPGLILDSAVVNKQWLHLSVWTIGLVVNLIANYLAARRGWGMLAIAWNDVWIQLLVVVALYALAQKHIYPTGLSAVRVYLILGLLSVVATLVFLGLGLPVFTNPSLTVFVAAAYLLGLRLVFVLLIWVPIGAFIFKMVKGRPAYTSGVKDLA